MSLSCQEATFERVTVLGKPALFTCCRTDHKTVPNGLHIYDVRHDDDQQGEPVQIARWVMVNHWGTLLTKEPLPLEENALGNNAYLDIDPENDWNYEGIGCSIEEFLRESGNGEAV